MAAELSFGSVPPFYREVYQIVCPNQESRVDRDMFVKILMKSSLPKQTLSEIWDAVDNKQGYLTRNGLYKALALTALAQQGKSINEKFLDSFSGQELPKPSLGDLTDLKTLSVHIRREKNPNVLGYCFKELVELDSIKLELVPEKKGILLKHVEYEVTSKRFKTTVMRRYNDFLAFQEILLSSYPYRMVPRLPPKKMLGANREFIEARRKSLRRLLTLIARHPVFYHSPMLKFFLTYSGSNMGDRIKEQFRGYPDEFMASQLASQAKDLVPMDTQLQMGNSKEQIRCIHQSVLQLKSISERMAARWAGQASDMLLLGRELSAMSNEPQACSAWAIGSNDTWTHLKRGFKGLSVEFATISDKCAQQSGRQEENVVEKLNLLQDLLMSYKELGERHEKGVLKDHQNALNRMSSMKKKKMAATIRGQEQAGVVDQLESRIVEQESEIMNMENRNYFSLHCIQMETQLVHANMELLSAVLQFMGHTEAQGYREVHQVWEELLPKLISLIPNSLVPPGSSGSRPTSPATSPLASPTTEKPPTFP